MSPVADLEPLGCHSRVVSVDTTVRPFKLECPLFYGVDFQGWRSKLEQFFEAEWASDYAKVGAVMLYLKGKAHNWNRFFA